MTTLTIIPVLEVCKPCHWCDPQKCFNASVWWGEVLMTFYTPHEERINDPEKLNALACDILRELTKAIKPGADEVIPPDELREQMKGEILACIWADFQPAVVHPVFGYKNVVTIPVAGGAS